MVLKQIIALFLGLAFQLALAAPVAVVDTPCASHGEACCCGMGSVCHCADRGDPDPGPKPVPFHNGETQKAPVARLQETRVTPVEVPRGSAPARINAQLPDVTVTGYSGVRLSIAFCSFVM